MKKELRGQVAFVTGGSKGIGFGIAQALVARGVHVVITGRGAADLESAKQRLQGAPGQVDAVVVDVRDYAAVAAAIAQTEGRLGGLDIALRETRITEVLVSIGPAWAQLHRAQQQVHRFARVPTV